jgi:hypothetical protein
VVETSLESPATSPARPEASGDEKPSREVDRRAEIAEQLAKLDLEIVDVLGEGTSSGRFTDILTSGEVPPGLLDDAAATGAGTGGLRLGAGGGGLAEIGGTGGSATPPQLDPPKATVLIAAPAVSGGSVANAATVIARMRARFRRCYQRAIKTTPSAAGVATLTAEIGPNGEVTAVTTTHDAPLDAVAPCLKAVVASGGFAPPSGGAATVKIALTFAVATQR